MKLLLTAIFTLVILTGFSQKNTSRLYSSILPFKYLDAKLDTAVINEIDLIWDRMYNGTQIEFLMLSTKERMLKQNDLQKLSKRRVDTVYNYLRAKQISDHHIRLKLTNFEDCTVGFCHASEERKAFQKTKGYYSIITEKSTYWRDKHYAPDFALQPDNCEVQYIDNNHDALIYLSQGTQINFPAQCFKRSWNKGRVKDPKIKITVCEYYSKADLLLAGLTTTMADQVLISGGTIYVKAEYKDKRIELDPGENIEVFFPCSDSICQAMRTFNGSYTENVVDWDTTGNDFSVWNQVDYEEGGWSSQNRQLSSGEELEFNNAQGEGELMMDMNPSSEYNNPGPRYFDGAGWFLSSSKLGWINCDRFMNNPNNSELIVRNNESYPMTYRMVFKRDKAVLPGYNYSAKGAGKFNNIPIGERVTILAFANTTDGRIVFGYKDITVGDRPEELLKVKILEIDAFKAQIEKLF
ncbi:MAG: hypothetical protein JKY54_17660 [Flavobacteriales bacterium]|nr:hypothetical protein [Flavobacteriales bacterium]